MYINIDGKILGGGGGIPKMLVFANLFVFTIYQYNTLALMIKLSVQHGDIIPKSFITVTGTGSTSETGLTKNVCTFMHSGRCIMQTSYV